MKNQKNKFLLSILIAFFVFGSLGGVIAKDVAYITKDLKGTDSYITSLLEEGGYTYDVVYQTALGSTDFSSYSIILVGEGIFSNPYLIPVNSKNAVILNSYHMDEWYWSGNGVSTKSSNYPVDVKVFDYESSIVEGVSDSFIPYNTDISLSSYDTRYIPKSLDAPGLNTIIADGLSFLQLLKIYYPKNGAVVATVDKGSILRDNQISNARGVFLGFTETRLWTQETKDVFYNSIEWAINGEDRDGDGFMSDLDCDDNNLEVYLGAEDIPYDGIDQDCDGRDLNDLDGDGFIAEIVGGDDCDDEDSEYNIASYDLTKNCINDAPIIDIVYRINVNENDVATILIEAYDPEEDEMTYEINDSRFVLDEGTENSFSWETGYEDEGDYKFFAIVSDGELSSEKSFLVKVWNRNKAPELLMEIPVQEWEEEGTHTLDLKEYFYDLDGDELVYLFHETSNNVEISLDKIEGGVAYFSSSKNWYGEDWIIFKTTDQINVVETNNITLRVLPINDAPELIEEIGTIELEEDEIYYFNLDEYIEDVDSDLEYAIENTTYITLSIDGNVLEIIPQENWYGEEEVEITFNDEEFELYETFNIKVISVNDAPEINHIEDKLVLSGWKVEVIASAIDVEGDEFTFSMNDSRFVKDEVLENYFSWQTGEEDFGKYTFLVNAYDGENYGYKEIKVNVLQKIFINELSWGSEGWIELYNPKQTPFDLEDCKLTSGEEEMIIYGVLEEEGFTSFGWNALESSGEVRLICNDILIDEIEYEQFDLAKSLGRKTDGFEDGTEGSFEEFIYPTRGVSNTADVTKPEVELDSPENNTLYTESRDITFEFNVKDNMAEELQCSIFANSKMLETENFENNTLGSFFIDYLSDGIYLWNVECSDGTNKNTALESWMVTISAPDLPILNKIGNKVTSEDNELKFSVYATDPDKDPIELYVLNIPEGASFTDNGNGNGLFVWKPNYNQSGSYTLEFTAEDSTGMKDSEEISILVGNTKEPPKFLDADTCSLKDSNIEVSIKDPDNGDDFEIGEIVEGSVKIKNEFDEDMDFEVKIYFYDITEEESLEEIEEEIDIKDGKTEEIEFSIEIPKDIEGDEFAIYVYVEGEDEECNSGYVEIEVERKKHEVIISEINVDREDISPGDEVKLEVKAENLGRGDEDVVIVVSIDALNIYQESEEIEIEKYGDKYRKTETFYISIPDNAKYGYYDIKASAIYDDGENYLLKEIIIAGRETSTGDKVNESRVINLNFNPSTYLSTTQGTPLTLGESSGSEKPSGSAIVIGSGESSRTSSTSRTRLFRTSGSVNLGVDEQTIKEEQHEVKVEFNGDEKTKKINTNQWVLLVVVLGLLIIVVLVLILFLKNNKY